MKDNALQRLPRELRVQILELVQLPSDLAALSATCKALRQVAEPFLYSSIRLQLDNNSLRPPVGLLLRTLLERPDLAHLIRHLNFESNRNGELRWNPTKDMLPSRVLQPEDKLEKAIESLNLPEDINWRQEVQSGNPDTTAALTISLCRDLTRLHMDHNWLAQARFLDRLLQKTGSESSVRSVAHDSDPDQEAKILQSLQNIELHQHFEVHTDSTPHDIENVLYLFYLPNLQQISAPLVNPVHFSWPCDQKPNPSNLASLELSRVRECFLGDILAPLTHLRRLRYNWMLKEDLDRHVNENNTIDLDAMVNAILPLKKTLEELQIHATALLEYSAVELPVFWLRGSLAGISQLGRLRSLLLPWNFVAGVWEIAPTGSIAAVVPVSVEHLALEAALHMDSGADAACKDWEDATVLEYIRHEFDTGAFLNCSNLRSLAIPGPDHTPPGPDITAEMDRVSKDFNIAMSFFDEFSTF